MIDFDFEFIVKTYEVVVSGSTFGKKPEERLFFTLHFRGGENDDKSLSMVFSSKYSEVQIATVNANQCTCHLPVESYQSVLQSLQALKGEIVEVKITGDKLNNATFQFQKGI